MSLLEVFTVLFFHVVSYVLRLKQEWIELPQFLAEAFYEWSLSKDGIHLKLNCEVKIMRFF